MLYSARLSSPKSVHTFRQNNLADELIICEHREKMELILFFKYKIILCVLCSLKNRLIEVEVRGGDDTEVLPKSDGGGLGTRKPLPQMVAD